MCKCRPDQVCHIELCTLTSGSPVLADNCSDAALFPPTSSEATRWTPDAILLDGLVHISWESGLGPLELQKLLPCVLEAHGCVDKQQCNGVTLLAYVDNSRVGHSLHN